MNQFFVFQNQSVHLQFLQHFFLDSLYICIYFFLNHRILNIVIKYPCRNHIFILMLVLLYGKGTIHVDHQLQLQAMIQGNQIKRSIPGLIINDPDIQLPIICLHSIHAIDPTALKNDLHTFRLKFPGFQLFLNCPHSSSYHSLGALDHIFIACTAF